MDLKGNTIALLAQFINLIECSERLQLGLNVEEWLHALPSVFSPFLMKPEVVSQGKLLLVGDWTAVGKVESRVYFGSLGR